VGNGTVAVGGCVFCDNRSFSPNRRLRAPPITEQGCKRGEALLGKRLHNRFRAYVSGRDQTYAP